MKNTYEVGITPDDNNDRRLPGSCNPEPMRGDSDYGPGKLKMAKQIPLDTADTGGVIGQPKFNDGFGMEDGLRPNVNSNVDTKNSDTSLMATVGDSQMNLSKKYKYPNVSQDIPSKGRPNTQYNDHT